ncbi:LacI family DNA-binding transcriptional regulator [Microbacterium sp. MRS-1]|uniref:LacI family DNA-binding transcriptional regulator n=1 Tax=Microbacterium sp. MRS-1 TaxID=1451261 RepID=UPI001E46DF62|nr:LacI family DNA-binding transcriptional regulator [Microbacterium sp. MRS-1]
MSRSAASFALNGRLDQRLSVETMARVRRAADELGYRANVTAKTLRTGRSGTVALVSDFARSCSSPSSPDRSTTWSWRSTVSPSTSSARPSPTSVDCHGPGMPRRTSP